MKRTKGEMVFSVINGTILTCLALLTLYPMINVLVVSFSDNNSVMHGLVTIFPLGFNTLAYEFLIRFDIIISGYANSIFVLVVGTSINIFLTCLTAYALAKPDLLGRNAFLVLITFTMMFNGGLIPHFLLMRDLGLINSLWVLILPGAISTYNMIIMKNFFQRIPTELLEAARVDGLSEYGILFRIVVPLSTASIATIGLFYAVGHWNSFFSAVIYLNQKEKWTLQVVLRDILFMMDMSYADMGGDMVVDIPMESLKRAAIVSTTFPILLAYPFVQKYFVKGITIGSVKG